MDIMTALKTYAQYKKSLLLAEAENSKEKQKISSDIAQIINHFELGFLTIDNAFYYLSNYRV